MTKLHFEDIETKNYQLLTRPDKGLFFCVNKKDTVKPLILSGTITEYTKLKALYLKSRNSFDRAVRIRSGFQRKAGGGF